jgi:hypothetical protein
MGFAAGFHFAMNARLLGFARSIQLAAFNRFLTVLWFNLALIVVSGVMLLSAFPAKVLANSVFYLKLLLIAVALVLTRPLCQACAAGAGAPHDSTSLNDAETTRFASSTPL